MKITPLISIESIQVYDFRLDGLEIKKKLKNGEEKTLLKCLLARRIKINALAGLTICVHVCIRMMYVYVWCQTSRALCSIVFEESGIIKKSS